MQQPKEVKVMTTSHFQVSAGMEVLDSDRERVGQVTVVRESDFVLARPPGTAIAVPFGAVGDVTGNQVVLTISADHIDTIKWPHQAETADEPASGDSGPQGPILL
jgi:hypothetical protein